MNHLTNIKGVHKLVTLQVPGREPASILCLVQKDGAGEDAFYVLAECEGCAFKWRSMIRDNAIRRLRDEYARHITSATPVDGLDIETIFLCTTEASKA